MNKLRHFPLFLFLTLGLLLSFVAIRPTLAQENTATTSAEEIQQSLKDRIKKALNENLDDAAETLNQGKQRAVVGIIESLNQNEITVLVNQGKTAAEYRHQVTYDEETSITKAGKTIESDDLSIGDYLIAIGNPLNPSSLTSEKIITSTFTAPTFNTEVVYATVEEINLDDETITLTGSHPLLDEFDITTKTDLITPNQTELDLDEITQGQKVAAVVVSNIAKKNTTLSSLIVFPALLTNTPTPEKSATSSASCGDNICQNITCFGQGCPTPESPETCPIDCTQ